MLAPQLKETVALNQCYRCGNELIERDKFCRRCGVSQSLGLGSSTGIADKSECETRPLLNSGSLYQSYSGPLVRAVTQGLSERTSSLNANRWVRRLISTLVAVPLWMMIVLLSPLEAYVAVKAIARQE